MASFGHVGTGSGSGLPKFHLKIIRVVVSVISVLAVVKLRSCVADDISSQEPVYFDQLYAQGVKAYNDQLWYKCAYNMENAMKEYNTFRTTLTDCRMRCKKEESHKMKSLPSDLEEFSMLESFLKHADCFRRCKNDAYVLRPGLRLTKILKATFESRKPYQYLQFCWYKLDRVKLAASASYTFYLMNPGDEDVKKNIAFYRDKAKVPESDFLDLEIKPYKEHYIRAMIAYSDENWPGVVDHLEKAIEEFFVEEERCRADCEDVLEDRRSSHFSGIIADHILHVLDCQLGCEGNLSSVYTVPIENFFPEQFHYLQYAYYKLEKIREAVAATAAYLLFHPEDDVVKDNKKIFMKKYHYSEEEFVPRKDVKEYVERRQKLQALLDYLRGNLMEEYPDVVFVTEADTRSERQSQDAPDQRTTDYMTWMERYERLGLHIIAKERDLKREYRFAADGLLKQEQCEDILSLMEDVDVDAKGVQTFTLAHGRKTMIRADENYETSLRLFMRATEVLRHYTQRYYNISGSLYFKNTSMVCWRQVEEPDVENDCIPQEFGTCDPEDMVRDSQLVENQFVTATYLNTLDDGDFYFLGENVSVDTSLGVKIGRTVGFQSGDRHGLHIPSTGPRCAMVIMYTTYRSDDEMDYISTIQMLQRVEEIRMEKNVMDHAEVMNNFKNMGVQVVRNSSSLHGGERFVADGLSSEAECMSLKNMVMDLGKAGDGYGGRESPHTQNELFAGLTLSHLTKSGALVGDGYDHLETKPSYISPHTEHETFQGLTIYRAAKLMHMGLVNTFAMQSFLDLSEKSRLFVEKYFNLTRPLYFDFTHLVCRSAVDDSKERDDLSHPVHSDNCVLQPDGSCLKEYPAYIQRDYSAILYLNDDFEGGEFFFAHANKSEQTSLRPKCGRLVGFNAASFHGVKAVRRGVRCAMALWFTMNPNFKELARSHAKKVLRTIQGQRDAQEKLSRQSAGIDMTDSGGSTPKEALPEKEKDKLDLKAKEGGVDSGMDQTDPGMVESEDTPKKIDSNEPDQVTVENTDDPENNDNTDQTDQVTLENEDNPEKDGEQDDYNGNDNDAVKRIDANDDEGGGGDDKDEL